MQRANGHSHSHDSAIDSDLQEWETEAIDLDMAGLGSQEDLRLDLAGGRDDLHCPSDKPIYVSSIAKGSFLEGKLKYVLVTRSSISKCIFLSVKI